MDGLETIHDSFPSMGEARPAHEGSQSSVPMPRPDPRGYDSESEMRDYGKYPASFMEKAGALFGAYRQMMTPTKGNK